MNPLSANALVRWRWLYAIAFLAITVAAWFPSRELRFSRTMETMFPPGRPLMNSYQRLKRTFGSSDVLLIAYADAQFASQPVEALARLRAAGERFKAIEGVQSVVSLATIDDAMKAKLGLSLADDSPAATELSRFLEGITHDRDRTVVAMVVTLVREPAVKDAGLLVEAQSRLQSRRDMLLDMRALAKTLEDEGYEKIQIAGEPVMVIEGFRLVEQDGHRLGWFSGLLLSLALLFLFRSVRWALLPLAVVFTSSTLTRATLALSGLQLSMVSSMLTAIITVVGVATVVHILVHFSAERAKGIAPVEAYVDSWRVLQAPIFWALLTDVAGFLSLLVAEVEPISDFGLMMALGSGFVLPGVMFLTPALALLPPWEERLSPPEGKSWGRALRIGLASVATAIGAICLLWGILQTLGIIRGVDAAEANPDPRFGFFATPWGFWTVQWVGAGAWLVATWGWRWFVADPGVEVGKGALGATLRAALFVTRYRVATLAVTLVLLAVALWGSARMEIESDFTRNFRSDSELVKSYEFVESKLGGAGVWEIDLPAAEKLDEAYLDRVRKLEERLRREVVVRTGEGEDDAERPGLTKVLSLADAVDAFGKASPVPLSLLPASMKSAALQLMLTQLKTSLPGLADSLHAQDPADEQWRFRILLRSRERLPSVVKERIIEQTHAIAIEEFPEAADPKAPPTTGPYVLLTYLIESLLSDQWMTFLVANGAILAMLLAAFRDVRLALIGLIPNILPILLVLGMVGFFGGKVNMGAAMIAAVSIGLAVDSALHYIYSFQQARRETGSTSAALAVSQESAGSAATYSTIALMLGFASLCGSAFLPTVYFGGLVCLAMLGGLFGNLVLLPALIRMVMPEGDAKVAPSRAAPSDADSGGSPAVANEPIAGPTNHETSPSDDTPTPGESRPESTPPGFADEKQP